MNTVTNNCVYEDLFDPKELPKKCMLCERGDLNKMGHIIPKLVMRWVKKGVNKQQFYWNNDKQYLVGDTIAIKMLCDDCEHKFSLHEKYFTDNLFKKYYRGKEPIEVDDDVYLLAISIAWRLVETTAMMKDSRGMRPRFKIFSESAKRILLGDATTTPLDVYVFSADAIEKQVRPEFIRLANLKHSIRQGLLIRDLNYDIGQIPFFAGQYPFVYFKLGVYYFIVTYEGYLKLATFSSSATRVGSQHNIYRVQYTNDFLGFLGWLGAIDSSEVDKSVIPSGSYHVVMTLQQYSESVATK